MCRGILVGSPTDSMRIQRFPVDVSFEQYLAQRPPAGKKWPMASGGHMQLRQNRTKMLGRRLPPSNVSRGCTLSFPYCSGVCAELHRASYARQVHYVAELALTCVGSAIPPSSSLLSAAQRGPRWSPTWPDMACMMCAEQESSKQFTSCAWKCEFQESKVQRHLVRVDIRKQDDV